jgi:hypothetical protein
LSLLSTVIDLRASDEREIKAAAPRQEPSRSANTVEGDRSAGAEHAIEGGATPDGVMQNNLFVPKTIHAANRGKAVILFRINNLH